jgi:hypothetical protein
MIRRTVPSARDQRLPSGPFRTRERLRQSAYFCAEFPEKNGYEGSACRLYPSDKQLNLAPTIRDVAVRYVRDKGIA